MSNDKRYALVLGWLMTVPGMVGCATSGSPAKQAREIPPVVPTYPSAALPISPPATAEEIDQDRQTTATGVELTSHFDAASDADTTTPHHLSVSGPSPGFAIQPASMTLADLESLALANNPTIRQLTAVTQKAAGFRQQVGLRANPVIGYQAMQLADEGTDQHTAFISQEFVTAGKLASNRRVLNEAVRAQQFELEAQQQRVRTDIRLQYFEALAAQQQVELTTEFLSVGAQGLKLAQVRKQAMEASQIEVLQAKIQMNQLDLARQQAEAGLAAAWRGLAALVGAPDLFPVRLEGRLDEPVQPLDWAATRSRLLTGSPELLAAQTRAHQARLYLERQGIQAIPNFNVEFAAGVDNATNSGLINLEVGAPIPIFNKNQGNIAAARADYCRALMDVSRIEHSIKARLATVSNEFDSALAAVNEYQVEILPSVRESLELAEEAYRAGEFSFLEVLMVRRTYFESSLQYLESQVQLARANAQVDGFVLSGGLEPTIDLSGDDGLRAQTFGQQ